MYKRNSKPAETTGHLPTDRAAILAALRTTLEPRPDVHAMWEAGAAAFGRVDEWSDLDLYVDADDATVQDVMATAIDSLRNLAPIAYRYDVPEPAWHGHVQSFLLLEGASPFQFVDLVVLRTSLPEKLLEPEIHGRAKVLFDKTGVTRVPVLDQRSHRQKIAGRLKTLKTTIPLFQPLVVKEINRRQAIEAMTFYQGYTLRPLVELLRIKHAPTRYNFHTRYVYQELPPEVITRLEPMYFTGSLAELAERHAEANAWSRELLAELSPAYAVD